MAVAALVQGLSHAYEAHLASVVSHLRRICMLALQAFGPAPKSIAAMLGFMGFFKIVHKYPLIAKRLPGA